MRSYLELTKPKIALLNIATAFTGYLLGGGDSWGLLVLFLIGYLAVGGSSAINHYLDRDLDARMSRTSRRPLPSGRIHPPEKALVFGIALLSSSLIASIIFFNILTAVFVGLGAAIYLLVYTLWLKRRSVWNIVIGGAAGSCSPLAGWAAATGSISTLPLLLALLIFLWTPGHFWSLAMRASEDYRRARIPMLPAVRDARTTSIMILVSNVATAASWLGVALLLPSNLSYLALTSALTILIIIDSVKLVRHPESKIAWRIFKASNPWLAAATFGTLLHIVIGV